MPDWYEYKTEPFPHQREEFERYGLDKARALFHEMGCGKSKPIIDSISYLYEQGEITAVVVVAPKAVAPNWSRTEIPRHMPERVAKKTRILLWRTEKAAQKGFQAELRAALSHDGLLVLCMSYNAVMTQRKPGQKVAGRALVKGFEMLQEVLNRPTMMVLDESARIKEPKTKWTKRLMALAPKAKYRRILTGTPIANSPFDVYSQIQFLDPFFWARHGCRGWPAFKNRYGEWIKQLRSPRECPHREEVRPNCGCPTFPMLVKYKNLDDLNTVIASVGTRLLKDDVLKHLPPKSYTKYYFEMSPPQQRLYDELSREFLVWLDNGDLITAPLVITKLLRLQEITSGYCPTDSGAKVLDPKNTRPKVAAEIVEDCPHQMIMWAKFQEDFTQLRKMLGEQDVSYVEYIGSTPHADRERARDMFQGGEAKVFLANPMCAGEGLTLTAARTVVYYNTSFRLADRLQSEARAHRSGQHHPVNYIDIVAQGTVDEQVIEALRRKKDLADLIMGDPRGNWI